ncbi:MAG: hypothetical protein NTZ42_02590 [Candidatus Gribaldobacteria bacterium]|nr:hypothetical protein [Candidatus Gribaldobacteria bacterium]
MAKGLKIFFVLIILAAVCAGVVMLARKSAPEKITSKWVSYSNQEAGFQASYPDYWQIKETTRNGNKIVVFDLPQIFSEANQDSSPLDVEVSVASTQYQNLEEYLKLDDSPAPNDYNYHEQGVLLGEVNGLEFYQYKWFRGGAAECYEAISRGKLIKISLVVDNNSAMDNAATTGIFSELAEYSNFQKFLYSFKLIK